MIPPHIFPGMLALLLTVAAPAAWAAKPSVVATIAPVHSLVAGVMEGVGTPGLLLKGGASPHSYALRPSDVRALNSADLVFRVDENLETFLNKSLRMLPNNIRVVELSGVEGVKLLEVREGGVWGVHGHGHDEEHTDHDDHDVHGKEYAAHEEEHDDHNEGEKHAAHEANEHGHNPHLWLDPANAKIWVNAIARELGEIDPANRNRYRANAAGLIQQLEVLEKELNGQLSPVKERPYIVFHDAYHYFEERFDLHPVGSISVGDAGAPGARRLTEIRRVIRERGALCVFAEPQFEPLLVRTVIEGSGARSGVLDPLGARLEPGPGLYFELMRALARELVRCLGGA
ncbi:MAG: zinc ABC transporter substrate-binding protein [Gammaproteobacteria bacterium]